MSVGLATRRPNFFLIGAAKSGTTSLANYLDQHPQIFLCKPKEPNFFAFPPGQRPSENGPGDPQRLYDELLQYSVTSADSYRELFVAAGDALVAGEASVRYLYAPTAAERIAAFAPQARLIVLLRHPVERMFSHYHMNVDRQLEPALSFSAALDAEDERVAEGWGWDWHYRRVGMYAAQLDVYYRLFARQQIHVELYDDFVQDPAQVLRRIFVHLGVADDFKADMQRRSLVGVVPKSRWLRNLVREENVVKTIAKRIVPAQFRKAASALAEAHNRRPAPRLDAEVRQRLMEAFADEASRLGNQLGRDLPW